MRARLIVVASALLLAVASRASAQDKAGATADAKQASAAIAQKRFADASGLYLSAYGKNSDPKYLFSAAGASQKSGDNVVAASLYARYLREAPEKAPSRKAATKELDALTPKVAQLVIKADGARSVSLDGRTLEQPLAPVIFVVPGQHVIVATFDTGKLTIGPSPTAGTTANLTLTAPTPPAPAPPAVVAKPEPPPVIKEEKRKPLPPAVVFVGAGLTVLAGGLTIASAIDTSHQKSTFDGQRSQENLDSGRDKEKRTNILLGATAGLAVLTGVTAILLVDWKGKPKSVALGVGPGTLVASGSF